MLFEYAVAGLNQITIVITKPMTSVAATYVIMGFFIGEMNMNDLKLLANNQNPLAKPAIILRDLWKGLELAKKYTDWVDTQLEDFTQGVDYLEVHLKVNINNVALKDHAVTLEVAKHIALMSRTEKGREYRQRLIELEETQSNTQVPFGLADIVSAQRILCDDLRLPESGRLMLYGQLNAKHGSPLALPAYGIDNGGVVTSGSSRATKPLSALLADHETGLSAIAFNKLLQANGYLEQKTRKAITGTKTYWSISAKGLRYGKNVTSPQNPRETQPHWYEDTFGELLGNILN